MFGLGPELHGQAILRSGANTAADVIPADRQIAAVFCPAADQKMHVRVVGIVVVNRNPVVLEGSVRKAGNRIRIAGQLIDAETGAHLWADRFEGALQDVFDLQDYATSGVVSAIAPKLQSAEIKRAKRKPTENLHAYDYYLRGLAKARRSTAEANGEALELFRKAIALDTDLACAYGMAAWCYVPRKARGWMIERTRESAEATRLARKAVRLGGDDAVALGMGGYALAFVAHEFDDAAAFMDRALAV
jgi:hypothetical protein